MSKKFAAFDALALVLEDEEAGVFSEGEDDFVEQQDYSDDEYDNLMTDTLKNDAKSAIFENNESESDENCENFDEISLPLNHIAPSSSFMSFTSEISSLPNSHSVMSFECHDAVTSKTSSPTSSSSPPLVASIATNKFFKNTPPEPIFKIPDYSQINSKIVRKKYRWLPKNQLKLN